MKTARFVTYFRVSTRRQGESGLGLEAQREAVRRFLGEGQVVASFEEVESGGRADRPALDAALKACRLRNATLLIAKLDRLARSVAFVSRLMEEGVDFVAVDNPTANRLTVHLLAAIAEHERELISQRTKAALQAAKARGVKLGNPNGSTTLRTHGEAARSRSIQVRTRRANSRASEVVGIIDDVREGGATSLRCIAAELNSRTIPAPRGGEWSAAQVRRVLAQAAAQ
ncbi:MAG: recombinase family protein [Caulobacteraceae bacterium]